MNGWARLDDVQVTSEGPFAVGYVVWRDFRGGLVCTVVAKATYKLGGLESAPLDAALPIQEEDGHWDDDASKSVHVPGDLAPFKSAAEIVVVGSAFAPGERPARSVTARVVVGSVDKSVDAWTKRQRRADGTLEEAAFLPRFSLRYEHAAGGPGTDNPAGIDLGRADTLGALRVPQLLPPFYELGSPSDHVPIAGFGPIAATWPARTAGLGPHERAWLRRPADSPLPQAFPARFFQAAPPDQWLDRALAANERIVLENLHATQPRLVMSLSGLEPRAVVVGSIGEPLRLSADLLFIDTDRGLATLTFRAPVPIGEGTTSLRIVVIGAAIGAEPSPEQIARILEASGAGVGGASDWGGTDVEITGASEDAVLATSTAAPPWVAKKPALPFDARQPTARPPQPAGVDGTMPFRPDARSAPSAPAPSSPALSALVSFPSTSTLLAAPAFAEVERESPRASAPFELRAEPETPRPSVVLAPAPPPPTTSTPPAFLAAFGGRTPKPSAPPSSAKGAFGAAFNGAAAASDAAAADEGRGDPSTPSGVTDAKRPPTGPLRRRAVVDLLHFDPAIAGRLRSMRSYAQLWARPARARNPLAVDDPVRPIPAADRDRADVAWVLSCGRPVDASEIHAALARSLDDLDDLELPIALVAGELRPIFDEVEALRGAIAVAQPLAGTDKKLLAAIAVAHDALAASHAPPPDTVLGLVRQIDQASLGLSLPPRYVATEVERLLLEGRKFKRRTLLGAARVRADLVLARSGETLPLYVPDSISTSLPLLASYPVVALCEVRPREDAAEAHAEALVSVALGRVVHQRGEE